MAGLRLLVGIRFQVSFTPLVGVLFTFPSRYWFAIGRQGVLRLGGWSPHVRTGFHVSRPTRGPLTRLPVRGCHPLWPAFPDRSGYRSEAPGLVRVRSPLLAESRLMSFPPATEMFQFAGFASRTYGFSAGSSRRMGFPHSEIVGSKPARGSPTLFAACHVLHRLLAPRHPPDALLCLRTCPRDWSHRSGQAPRSCIPPATAECAQRRRSIRSDPGRIASLCGTHPGRHPLRAPSGTHAVLPLHHVQQHKSEDGKSDPTFVPQCLIFPQKPSAVECAARLPPDPAHKSASKTGAARTAFMRFYEREWRRTGLNR